MEVTGEAQEREQASIEENKAHASRLWLTFVVGMLQQESVSDIPPSDRTLRVLLPSKTNYNNLNKALDTLVETLVAVSDADQDAFFLLMRLFDLVLEYLYAAADYSVREQVVNTLVYKKLLPSRETSFPNRILQNMSHLPSKIDIVSQYLGFLFPPQKPEERPELKLDVERILALYARKRLNRTTRQDENASLDLFVFLISQLVQAYLAVFSESKENVEKLYLRTQELCKQIREALVAGNQIAVNEEALLGTLKAWELGVMLCL